MYLILCVSIISCVSQKPTLKNVSDEDNFTQVYYSKNDFSLDYNGDLVYNLISFGTTNLNSEEVSEIKNAESETNNLLSDLFVNFDYSFALEPSLSLSSKYLAKATEDFSLFNIRFNTNVDIDILDLTDINNKYNYTIKLPHMEYDDEKYQIPWSNKDDAFFGIQNDSLFKFYPYQKSKRLFLSIPDLYDFNLSKSEKYSIIFASDTLWCYNLENNTKNFVYSVGKSLGINRKYVRSLSWNEDESKATFSIGWHIFIYSLHNKELFEVEADSKVFFIEWIEADQLLIVIGDYPSDMSSFQNNRNYSLVIYSIKSDKFKTIHKRINHEPFSIKPRLSPSKNLILFSERKLNGPYQVKLMTLDGQNENILAEGYLPFWGK